MTKIFTHQYLIEEPVRKALWLNHGCDSVALYGDDGEMQCGSCGIDFLRDPLGYIEDVLG